MSYKIIPVKGHYEIYVDGEFFCSADSWSEAEREIEAFQLDKCLVEV